MVVKVERKFIEMITMNKNKETKENKMMTDSKESNLMNNDPALLS